MGSICGGGRYDNLTGIFGLPGVSGVGISFGADRIYDVLTALELFPDQAGRGTTVVFANFGAAESAASMALVNKLRAAGISAEIYPDCSKMKKQIGYADGIGAQYFAIIGENELAENTVTIKCLADGCQQTVNADEIVSVIK